MAVTAIQLPALRVNGQSARAHTQGLEVHSGNYYVTARREDVRPKRALLLRTDARATDWDAWDITPADTGGGFSTLDHPGGLQSDGARLWVPLAESRPKGRSLICAFPMAGMVPGQPLKKEFEFSVSDHIGAVAVSASHKRVFGANWDTETVYVWDFDGRLQQTLSGSELERRGLGTGSSSTSRHKGLAVQDWKVVGGRLVASGLFRGDGSAPGASQSRLLIFGGFAESGFQCQSISLPIQNGTELAREGMAISEGLVHFLPEDLGASNRIFRVSLADLMQRNVVQDLPSYPTP